MPLSPPPPPILSLLSDQNSSCTNEFGLRTSGTVGPWVTASLQHHWAAAAAINGTSADTGAQAASVSPIMHLGLCPQYFPTWELQLNWELVGLYTFFDIQSYAIINTPLFSLWTEDRGVDRTGSWLPLASLSHPPCKLERNLGRLGWKCKVGVEEGR